MNGTNKSMQKLREKPEIVLYFSTLCNIRIPISRDISTRVINELNSTCTKVDLLQNDYDINIIVDHALYLYQNSGSRCMPYAKWFLL